MIEIEYFQNEPKLFSLYFLRTASTEVYDPTSGTFEEGPALPISFAKSPCAVRTPFDTILILGRNFKSQDNNKLYEYFPADNTFNELPDMLGRATDMICLGNIGSLSKQFNLYAYNGYT